MSSFLSAHHSRWIFCINRTRRKVQVDRDQRINANPRHHPQFTVMGLFGGEIILAIRLAFWHNTGVSRTDRRTDGRNCHIIIARCIHEWTRTKTKKADSGPRSPVP